MPSVSIKKEYYDNDFTLILSDINEEQAAKLLPVIQKTLWNVEPPASEATPKKVLMPSFIEFERFPRLQALHLAAWTHFRLGENKIFTIGHIHRLMKNDSTATCMGLKEAKDLVDYVIGESSWCSYNLETGEYREQC
jgi:hypothetical protein